MENNLIALKKVKKYLRDIKKTYPVFIPLINHFDLVQKDMGNITISSDLKQIYFNENMVIENIKCGKELENVFAILHVLLHHALGHTTKNGLAEYMLYDLATDQKVDELAYKLLEIPIPKCTSASTNKNVRPFRKPAFKSNHNSIPIDSKRLYEIANEKAFDIYKDSFGNYAKLKKVYKRLEKTDNLLNVKIKADRNLIASDDHSYWRCDQACNKGENIKRIIETISLAVLDNENLMQQLMESASSDANDDSEDIFASKLLVFLENQNKFSKFGKYSLDVSKEVNASLGSGEDYREVIKSLLTQKEIHKVIPDSIDYMYYSYGLSLYDNVPLIEPKEVDEMEGINNLVIAIDTSGSCDGEMIENFLREIQGIIQLVINMGTNLIGNIHVLMCDCKICEVKKYDRVSIAETDFSRIQVKGYGGTDFTPVFEYINNLTDSGNKVDGLIYFTDGFGKYPDAEQEVNTVFVLDKANTNTDGIPGWIRKTYFK